MMRFIWMFNLVVLCACNAQEKNDFQSLQNQNSSIRIDSSKTLKEIVSSRKIQPRDLKILVKKSERVVEILFKDELLIQYPCVLGFEPFGDKMQEGDGKTPEGKFKIKAMYPHKSWSYFIWFDYPNQTSYQNFKERKSKKIISQTAAIGGEVGFHGVPEKNDEIIEKKIDWTLGCISLSTKNITDLYQSIGLETTIEIIK
jgi:murein L,D-transpeptidase YafK